MSEAIETILDEELAFPVAVNITAYYQDAIPRICALVDERVKSLITHLCDTKVIDCSSVEGIMAKWVIGEF